MKPYRGHSCKSSDVNFEKEFIKVRFKNLHIIIDEEYLHCETKDGYKFNISIIYF